MNRRDERGTAMVTVLGVMMLSGALLLTALGVGLSTATDGREHQDAAAALAAAQAGIDDYVSRLNADESYWVQGETDADNPAFGAGATMPGTSGASGASFTYHLLTEPEEIAAQSTIRLRVTGRSGPVGGDTAVERTLTATLRPQGFLDHLFLSDMETVDPQFLGSLAYVRYNGSWYQGSSRYRYLATSAGITEACSKRFWEGRDAPSFTASAATPVQLWDVNTGTLKATKTDGKTADGLTCGDITRLDITMNGPFHTNDTLKVVNSPLFTDPDFTSSWPDPPDPERRWYGSGTPSLGTAEEPGYWPQYADEVALPSGNQDLLEHVEPLPTGSTSDYHPGCKYTGATRIVFSGTRMKVLSPSTTTAPARCLDVSRRGQEQTVDVPPLVYVDATTTACTAGALGYPRAGEVTTGNTTDYSCGNGTVLVQGSVDGRVTVAARDDVVVTGDLTVADDGAGTDVVGLVADNMVWVYHPVTAGGSNLLATSAMVHEIDAAVLSLRHSFLLQNWSVGAGLDGADGILFTGSVSQKFTGPFGTWNTATKTRVSGVTMTLAYDGRLRTMQPPFFLSPDSATWAAVSTVDG